MWIGLGFVLTLLQVWSLFAPVGGVVAMVLGVIGLVGMAPCVTKLLRPRPFSRPLGVSAFTVVAVLWLANRALAAPSDYDLGLYHASATEYVSRFAVIPGLGNLHDRLGAADGHFLLVAVLGRWPWSHAGFRLATGLLAAFLCVEIAGRLRPAESFDSRSPYSRRMALLLIPATFLASVGTAGTAFRLASPNLDFAAFVLVAVGCLYLAESVEVASEPVTALASTSALAVAAVTRPLYWPAAILAALVVVLSRQRLPGTHLLQRITLVGALPLLLSAGWAARQAILTGYPFFPSTVIGLPVDWRMPANAVHRMNQVDMAWARWPHKAPAEVLASWRWLGPWLRSHCTNPDLLAPALLLVSVLPALALRAPGDAVRRRTWLGPMSVLLLLSVPTLITWFLLAPDPRFVLAPLWLVPIALLAWALPSRAEAHSKRARRNLVVYSGVGIVMTFFVFSDVNGGALRPVVPHGSGPFNTTGLRTPSLRMIETTSGLRLLSPTTGDRCWQVLLCTPEPHANLSLRGPGGIGDGFRVNTTNTSS